MLLNVASCKYIYEAELKINRGVLTCFYLCAPMSPENPSLVDLPASAIIHDISSFHPTPQIIPHGEARLECVDIPKGLRDVRVNAELSSGIPYTTIIDPIATKFAERLIFTLKNEVAPF